MPTIAEFFVKVFSDQDDRMAEDIMVEAARMLAVEVQEDVRDRPTSELIATLVQLNLNTRDMLFPTKAPRLPSPKYLEVVDQMNLLLGGWYGQIADEIDRRFPVKTW